MPYDLVIFDFDGTLADSFPWFLRIFNEVADRFGFKRIEPGEEEFVRGLGSREILAHFGVPTWKLPLIAAHMRRIATRDIGIIGLFPGADALLRRLDGRGVAIGIVSSNTEANVRRVLGPDLAGRISHYACGASLFGKATKFRSVLKASGIPPHRVLCVGDEVRDVEAARSAGLASGAVAWGYARIEALAAEGPDEVFDSFDAMAARLAA